MGKILFFDVKTSDLKLKYNESKLKDVSLEESIQYGSRHVFRLWGYHEL